MAFTHQIAHDLRWTHSVLQRARATDISRIYRIRQQAMRNPDSLRRKTYRLKISHSLHFHLPLR